MSSENPFPLFENLLPFRLRRLRKKIADEWTEISDAELRNRDHLQL
jgi:uncharacterized protein YjeT (DUF2065 family)